MKHFSILALCFFAFQASITAQDSIPKDVLESIKSSDLKRIVYKLASPEMEGRGVGTEGIVKASEYISASFKSDGIGYLIPLNGFFQKVDFQTFRLDKPIFKIGKMYCNEYENYVGSLTSFQSNRPFDIVITSDISPEYIQKTGFDDKTILILTKDIFFEKRLLYNKLIKKGCRGVILCNPYSKRQFSDLSKIYSTRSRNRKDKLKVAFSGSIEKTDSLFKNLKYKNYYISTIVVHPRVVSNLLNVNLNKIVNRLSIDVKDSSINKTIKSSISVKIDLVKKIDESNNVLGFIEGTEKKGEVVVISAHYDHLGKEGGRINYGADDNASGVAAVMEIAEAYAKAVEKGFKPKRSIVFAAFSAEESGLWGSRLFVKNSDSLRIKPVLNINLDMVGRGEDSRKELKNKIKKVYAIAHQRDSLVKNKIKTINLDSDSLFIDYKSTDLYSSDQASFITKNIPAVMFFRGLHSDYHTERDTPEKLDYRTMERITRLAFKVSWEYVR